MWTYNSDTGKWESQSESLPISYFNNWKQELQSVALYSRALSGATYLPIKGGTWSILLNNNINKFIVILF